MSAAASSQAVPVVSRKARILCLHGYRQTGEIFRAKSGALRKALRHVADLVYIDAPHANGRHLAWWEAALEGDERKYVGLSDSIAHVHAQGDFDGILGFSQGAVLASILAATYKYKFAILISGFPARTQLDEFQCQYTHINVPSLHIWGDKDDLVPPEASIKLKQLFLNAQSCEHDGGHVMPGKRATLDVIKAYIEQRNADLANPDEGGDAESAGHIGKL